MNIFWQFFTLIDEISIVARRSTLPAIHVLLKMGESKSLLHRVSLINDLHSIMVFVASYTIKDYTELTRKDYKGLRITTLHDL